MIGEKWFGYFVECSELGCSKEKLVLGGLYFEFGEIKNLNGGKWFGYFVECSEMGCSKEKLGLEIVWNELLEVCWCFL